MAKIRVWNITDDARTDVEAHNRMVLGKVVKPGRSILVDEERLNLAHKVMKEVRAGMLHIGDEPPAEYVRQKSPPRATVDARVVDKSGRRVGEEVVVATGHKALPMAAVVADGVQAVETKLTEEVKAEDDVSFNFRKKRR